MKIAVTAVVAALAGAMLISFLGTPAAVGADPLSAKVAKLERQVKTLQTQVKALRREVNDVGDQLILNWEGDTCLGAQVSDLIQGTWGVIDQLSVATQAGKTYFGSQVATDDYDNCSDLARPNVPRPGIVVPPTIEPMRPLLRWLHIDLG